MRKHLFFRKIPDQLFLERLLKCYGIPHFGADITFTKDDLRNIHVQEKVIQLLDELRTYYIPCKAKVYLQDISVQKCVTILRQILRLHTCYLLSNQKMKNGQKVVLYTIIYPDKPQQLRKAEATTTLSFD